MSAVFFLISIGFFLLSAGKTVIWIFIMFLIYGYYLFRKFNNRKILWIWLFFGALSFFLLPKEIHVPVNGIYRIYAVKESYCLAHNGKSKVIVYGLTDPNFDDTYYLDNFEEIDAIRNIGQFSFCDYLAKEGVAYQVYVRDETLREKGWTIRSILFSKIKNHPCSDLYKGIFFGIYTDAMPDLWRRLSLPFAGFLGIMERLFNHFLGRRKTNLILTLITFLFGYNFVFTISLYRIFLNRLARVLFDDFNVRFSFVVIVFICLFPQNSLDFSFVFPECIQLIYHFIHSQFRRFLLIKILLLVMELLYFGQVEIVSLFLFTLLRTIAGYSFLFSIFFVFFSFEPFSLLNRIIVQIPQYTFYYHPGFIYLIIGCLTFFTIISKDNSVRKAILIFCCMIWPFIACFLDPCFHVYMIDIGQGDCTLIVEPFHRSAVMIDCGQSLYRDNMTLYVIPFLKSIQVHRLDCLILTHDDFDHSGGYESLSQQIEIKQLITDSDTPVPVSYPFLSLCPERNPKDENDKSIVSYFEYDTIRYLWMGDASIDVEKQILNEYADIHADVLKLGHHGSNTSSSFNFLNQTEPQIGLISVGKKNHYGHPDSSVITHCSQLGIHVLMTKDVGMVKISSFYSFHWIESATGLFGFF